MTKPQTKPHLRIFAKAGATDDVDDQSWYRIKAAAGDNGAKPIEIELYGEIGGWGIRAIDFLRELKALDDGTSPVHVGINSLGGDVFEGLAINNAFRRLGDRVTVRIDSVAASIASVIAVGAHQVVMPENAMMMIHNPWTDYAWGEADDLRKAADMLDKVRDNLVASYRAKAPQLDEAELIKMLDDTTWLTAQEAVALGLADIVATTVPLKASAAMRGLSRLKNAPQTLIRALTVPPPPQNTPPEPPAASSDTVALAKLATRLCAEANFPALAECVVTRSALANEAAVREAVEQAIVVRDLCVTAKLPDLADGFIRAGLSADTARTRLFDKLVTAAAGDFDPTPPPASDTPRAAGPNAAQVYAKRRAAGAARSNNLRGNNA
ncbi:head maturation protease, ClpP-related [Rivihabitans pingtungensis]|uniref:head maturation protease, ClpP-related n=1 Tax=Rivihabitans pingtungensis TaxID=1054498 RepID=UPI002352FDA2|nr:head maturation protease, ClpP-related [Rivihabitans pingtungensis]MCK6435979.1 Clp protease ClpP [Rivihabitans pingtungensis]